LQAGTPVLISDQTPWKNLEYLKVGWDLPLESQEQFVKTIEGMVNLQIEEFVKLSENAIRFSKDYATSEKLIEENKKLFV